MIASMLRFASRRMPPDARVLFGAQDDAPARSAGIALDRPVTVLPCPFDGEPRLRTECRRIGFLGHQRPEKGIDHLVALTQALRQRDATLSVLVHDSGFDLEQSGAAETLRGLGAEVEIGPVTPGQWQALLQSCDILMAPDDPLSGPANHSAIVTEAVAGAIPVIVPAATGAADFVRRWNGGHETFADWTVPGIAAAVERLQGNFTAQAQRSLAAADAWQNTQGADRFAQVLLDQAAQIAADHR
ncbi:MAG: glycosyltransferase [Azospirillaceae bacterium]|nr:glycosyltransferase [Azospirillaceae bacterium]